MNLSENQMLVELEKWQGELETEISTLYDEAQTTSEEAAKLRMRYNLTDVAAEKLRNRQFDEAAERMKEEAVKLLELAKEKETKAEEMFEKARKREHEVEVLTNVIKKERSRLKPQS